MELRIPVDGGEVWAEHVAGPGVPVVLLHPGVGDSRVWDPVMPRLVERHRVIRYDVRGYGRSAAPTAGFSLAGDLVSVLDQLGLEQVVLVGCSMGGDTALSLALAEPARVRALALLCPGVSGFPMPEEPELDAELDALVEARDVAGVVQFGLRLW
jgi:pimeloyl-ACP methyl ester carboxylesterase